MAATLKILVPESTTNYILNPSFRYDDLGWNVASSAKTRVLDQARIDIASLKVVTSGLTINEGVYYRVSALSGISSPVTVSIYVRGNAGNERVRIRLIDNPAGKQWIGETTILTADRWTRLEVSGFSTGSNDMRLYVETDYSTAKVITFFVDGAQMECKPYSTTYCDGNQPGCYWNILDNSSISKRNPATRVGGRWVSLTGSCKEDSNIYVTVLSGFGMPPIANNFQSWALAPGSYYSNTKIQDRVVTLNFTTKNKNLHPVGAPDLSPLHILRQKLMDIVKPDLTGGGEAFMFQYQEGDRPLYIWMRYEAGLEGQWDIRNQWINSFAIRLIANNPAWFEDDQETKALTFSETDNASEYIAMYHDGFWSNMNYGFNGAVCAIARGRKNEIYAGGNFTIANNNAAAIDPFRTVNRIAYWDGEKWNAMGSGTATVILGIAVAPNGDVYVTGAFTTIGGVAANRVAKWDGTSWSALGTGLNTFGLGIAIAPNGYVYVVGRFTQAGGIDAYYCAYWDGSSWHAMGSSGGLDNYAWSIVINQDGTKAYLSGQFHLDYFSAVTYNHVVEYDTSTHLFTALATGLPDICSCVSLSPAGVLYGFGPYPGGVKRWNGSSWILLGAYGLERAPGLGPSATGGRTLAVAQDESLVVAGYFAYANRKTANGFARWNGSTWIGGDVSITPETRATLIFGDDIFLGFGDAGGFKCASLTTVNYSGTMEGYPIVYVYGSGKLLWLENQTTEKRVYLDLDINIGEEVFIDFGKSEIYSTIRGPLYFGILLGSDFGDFSLIPGDNVISAFMINDVNAKIVMYHTPIHWSADASQTPEAL